MNKHSLGAWPQPRRQPVVEAQAPTRVTQGTRDTSSLHAPIASRKGPANVPLPPDRFGLPEDVDLSEIVTEAGDRFVVTNTQEQGARKKYRIALDLQTGEAFADLEFRTAALAPYVTKYGGRQTGPTSFAEVQAISRALQRHGRIIPERMLVVDRSTEQAHAQKIHLLVTLMTQDVYGAIDRIEDESNSLKRALTRRVAIELVRDLKRVHDRGEVHGDLKLENALMSAARGIALSDWDTVQSQRAAGLRQGLPSRATCPAPEVVMKGPYTASSDIWSLGVALGDAYNKSGVFCAPLFKEPQVAAFQRFHKALFTPWGAFRNGPLLRGGDAFSAYFRSFYEADPQLCELVLRFMVQPAPSKRRIAEGELTRLCAPGTPTYEASEAAIKALDESHYRSAVESALQRALAAGAFDVRRGVMRP